MTTLTQTEARQAARWAAQAALRDEQQYARRHLQQTGKRMPRDVDVLRASERQMAHVLILHDANLIRGDALWDALLGLLVGDRIPAEQRAVLLRPLCTHLHTLLDEGAR